MNLGFVVCASFQSIFFVRYRPVHTAGISNNRVQQGLICVLKVFRERCRAMWVLNHDFPLIKRNLKPVDHGSSAGQYHASTTFQERNSSAIFIVWSLLVTIKYYTCAVGICPGLWWRRAWRSCSQADPADHFVATQFPIPVMAVMTMRWWWRPAVIVITRDKHNMGRN